LVYLFAGDDCAKDVADAVTKKAIETGTPLSSDFIDEASATELANYKGVVGNAFFDAYRKIIWVQMDGAGFAIWSAFYRGGRFVAATHPPEGDGRCNVYAGDPGNQALYTAEYYYNNGPLKSVCSLQRMAAHVILTGSTFNASVRGLGMIVGKSNEFTWVPQEKIQALTDQSRRIHTGIDNYFNNPDSILQAD